MASLDDANALRSLISEGALVDHHDKWVAYLNGEMYPFESLDEMLEAYPPQVNSDDLPVFAYIFYGVIQ